MSPWWGWCPADQSLYTGDLRAGERTFSLLTQVVGRAGRGSKTGCAIIQTYTPENEIIQCAARQDYDQFYDEEIQLRRLRGYPPFLDLFVLTASGLEESAVLRTCLRLRQALEKTLAQQNTGISRSSCWDQLPRRWPRSTTDTATA